MGKYLSPKRYLSEDEYCRIKDHVRLVCVPTDRILFHLLSLGMRISECLGVMRSGLDLALQTIKFERRKQKQASFDTLPIPGEMQIDFELFANARPFPPDWRLVPYNRITAWKRLRRWAKSTQVPYISPHMLRHTFGIRWVSRGGSLVDLARWLGHRTLQSTMVYVKWCPEDLRRRGEEIGLFSSRGPVATVSGERCPVPEKGGNDATP